MSLLVSLKDTEGRTGVKGTKGATFLFLHVLTQSRLPSQGSLIPSSHHILLGEGSERFTGGYFKTEGHPLQIPSFSSAPTPSKASQVRMGLPPSPSNLNHWGLRCYTKGPQN